MKTCHRWSLFAVAVPFNGFGAMIAYEAWWMPESLPVVRCVVFGVGLLIFGVGMALVAGATRRD